MADAPVEPERVLPVRLEVALAAGNVHLRVCQLQYNNSVSSFYSMFNDGWMRSSSIEFRTQKEKIQKNHLKKKNI